MQVTVDKQTFPYAHLFLVMARAAAAPPIEPVGVFISKQRVLGDGLAPDQPNSVLMTDEAYPPPEPPPGSPPDPPLLALQFESDLVPTKPVLDLVVVRDSAQPGRFGRVRVRRRAQTGRAMNLDYGWRDRNAAPRLDAAGDIANFTPVSITDPANPPPLLDRLALPTGFQNSFFNGSPLSDQSVEQELEHLTTGDRVEFFPNPIGTPNVSVNIPPGPSLAIHQNDAPISPVVPITLGADTIIYNRSEADFLVTWRAVFPWSDRLESATLMVT